MSGARETWCKLHEQRADLLATQCRTLTELSDGQIRATLVHGGSADAITEKLKSLLTGANIRAAKIEELAASFASSRAPVRQLQRVMHELESLALLDPEDGVEQRMPKTPLLIAAGFTERELVRMARKISPEAWVDLSVVPLSDQPTFAYRLREDDYIPFADASAGQQATSLLWALLNQDGPPLLIDQPEDDLDNQVLLKIVEQIWGAKQRRQLICSSHNANLVVNGDADLVIACDYRVAGEQAGGTIKLQGAIDVRDVRNEIATVMEGGRAAFRLRKEKYGF